MAAGDESTWAHTKLFDSLALGSPTPFELASGGDTFWQWLDRPEHAASNLNFNRVMSGMAVAINTATFADYPWRRHENQTLSDVGGGIGGFLAGLLASQPSMRGLLVDRPSVIEDAGLRAGLAARGWAAFGLRCTAKPQRSNLSHATVPSRLLCLCREALGAEPPRPAATSVNPRRRLLQDAPAGRRVSVHVHLVASFW